MKNFGSPFRLLGFMFSGALLTWLTFRGLGPAHATWKVFVVLIGYIVVVSVVWDLVLTITDKLSAGKNQQDLRVVSEKTLSTEYTFQRFHRGIMALATVAIRGEWTDHPGLAWEDATSQTEQDAHFELRSEPEDIPVVIEGIRKTLDRFPQWVPDGKGLKVYVEHAITRPQDTSPDAFEVAGGIALWRMIGGASPQPNVVNRDNRWMLEDWK